MNRLFIIGNGFDLNHGLKTSYGDFINWYKSLIVSKIDDYKFHRDNFYSAFENTFLENKEKTSKNLSIYNHSPINEDKIRDWKTNNYYLQSGSLLHDLYRNESKYALVTRSNFFTELLNSGNNGWVNIEKIYYSYLLKAVNLKDGFGDDRINEINAVMKSLKVNLNNYLTQVYKACRKPLIQELFFGNHDGSSKTMFLNFNYTPLIRYYLDTTMCSTEFYNLIHIHGELNSKKNKMIFGYGDEMDDHYSLIEKLDDNRYLQNMKSFGYGETDNHRKMLEFIQAEPFAVHIMGHSCGLSDRVLLNNIFENDNCKEIIIHYYLGAFDDQDDYTNLYQNISRHFNKKHMQREKVRYKDPQYRLE